MVLNSIEFNGEECDSINQSERVKYLCKTFQFFVMKRGRMAKQVKDRADLNLFKTRKMVVPLPSVSHSSTINKLS